MIHPIITTAAEAGNGVATIWALIGTVSGGAVGTAWAVIERMRSSRKADAAATLAGKDEVITVKDEMIKSLKEEHELFIQYRKKHHDSLEQAHAKMLMLTNENAELRARTDLAPLMAQQQSMQEVTLKILHAQDTLMKTVAQLCEKVHALCDFHEEDREEREARQAKNPTPPQ